MATITKEFKPQSEDYFTLTGLGVTASGQPAPEAPVIKTTIVNDFPEPDPTNTTPYYTTFITTTAPQYLGYTFLYVDGQAYSNPITKNSVANIGATAINGLSLRIDQVTISNNYSDAIVIDLIKATPANVTTTGQNEIPPVPIARYNVPAGETLSLNKDDIDIVLKNYIGQTQSQPYYMSGDGLALAFPNSVTTTASSGTTTAGDYKATTYSTKYGIYNVNVTAVAHYEP